MSIHVRCFNYGVFYQVWDLSFESYWSGASCKVTMVGHMHTVRCLQVKLSSSSIIIYVLQQLSNVYTLGGWYK